MKKLAIFLFISVMSLSFSAQEETVVNTDGPVFKFDHVIYR